MYNKHNVFYEGGYLLQYPQSVLFFLKLSIDPKKIHLVL